MRSSITAMALVAGASAAAVSNATEPCAKVSAAYTKQTKAGVDEPIVTAELAFECLQSVPLGKSQAIELVDAIEPYLQWQSDAAYKANPPADYYYPAFSIFDNLDKVRSNLKADKYENEYAFQKDLYLTVFGMGHDGHYVMYPDLLARAFQFIRQHPVVSISEDGKSLPQIKLYEDVMSDPATASTVEKINGEDASTYILDVAASAAYNQDIDAAYNSMFFEKAWYAEAGYKGSFAEGGRPNLVYHGPTTSFTFENGTEVTVDNQARIIGDMTGVTDGESFYKKFCTPQTTKSAEASSSSAAKKTGPVGYPEPVITTRDAVVSGYYLDGEGVEDVAVLVLLAMESASIKEFQAVISDFLQEAKAAGKTKLVVDFQANGGGYILLGYDFFRQLFPDIVQDGFSRWKENSGFMAMSHAVSAATGKGFDPYTSDDVNLISLYETWFNWRYDLDINDDDFTSFKDKFAKQVYEETPYTEIMRWNLSDPLTTTNATYGMGIEISGYGTLSNLTQPFAAEDIVMLYDGVCASTCTISSEMLRIQGKVKSVAMGGRPQAGPIQGVGGVKGSQILNFADVYTYAGLASNYTDNQDYLDAMSVYSELPFQRATAAAANVRDQILRDHVEDGLPAQYVVEEADCRLYWTADMVSDVSKVWEAAANAAFNNAECAYGGIQYPSGTYPTSRSHRSRPAAPATARSSMGRLSELVDKTPDVHSAEWLAMHRQKAIV